MDNFDLRKYLAEGRLLKEAISLDIEDDIAILSGDSGEYEGEIKDGKASFSVMYDDLDYRISDQYNENNIEDFLGKNHAFVEASKKYNHNWDIERDLVGITIQLKESNESLSVGRSLKEETDDVYGDGDVVVNISNLSPGMKAVWEIEKEISEFGDSQDAQSYVDDMAQINSENELISYLEGRDIDTQTIVHMVKAYNGLKENKMDNFDLRKYLAEGRLLKEEITDIQDIIVKAGINLDDGILGGVGSGGAGYYDFISDKISGFNLDKFDENEFNNWYNNFSKEDFSSTRYEKEFSEENEDGVNYDMIGQINPGIYAVGDMGYAQIHDNGDVELFATPMLGDEDINKELEPIFTMDSSGNPVPAMDREEVITKLKQGGGIL